MSFDAGGDDGPILAVAIEQGRLGAGIVDRTGEVYVRDRITTPTREVWRALEGLIRRVMAAAPIEFGPARIAGVSCDGPIDQPAGAVSPPVVGPWASFPLRDRLEDLTGLPVVLDTAGAAATEAERWLGAARGMASYVYVIVDRTVESGCVMDGVRLRGALGNAGSIAHVNVEPGGRPCWCGAEGCLTAYVSSRAIEAEMNRPLRRATEPIIELTGIMLGRAIASVAAIVDVTTFFVAGTVIDSFGDTMLEIARREVAERSRLPTLAELRIIEPDHGIPPLVAAAALAR
ncbi:MAG: ROK family protein [Ilumatobacteraceae bacterium]